MSSKKFYKFLIIGVLFISLIASNINSSKMNLLGLDLILNFRIFNTTLIYLFLFITIFVSTIFLLSRKFVNKKIIVTLLILYVFYQIICLAIALIKNQEIIMWIATLPFYPLFGLIFLDKNWDFESNVAYLLGKIKWFIYLAISVGVVAMIAKRDCQFLDLLSISLLLLSFELLVKKNVKALLLVMALAFVSGFNLTWLFAFSFLMAIAGMYYLKYFNIRKIIFMLVVVVLAGCLYFSSDYLTNLGINLKLPARERFTQDELVRSTGRMALWEKYIYGYNGSAFEVLFGHGSAFVYAVSYDNRTFAVGHLHNIFFDEFYKRGIVGLLFLLSIIVISLRARAPSYLKVFFILLIILGQSSLIIFEGAAGIIFWMTVGILNNARRESPAGISEKLILKEPI